MNEDYSTKWPNIVRKGVPPEDGKEFENIDDKFNKYFSEKPGKGTED
jgi:ferredoxin